MKAAVFFLPLAIILTGCTSANISKPQENEGPVSIITGKTGGVSLADVLGQAETQPASMPVNAILWRAALDIAALLPIADIDTFGGTIVTDWYSLPEKPNERIKLTIFVVDRELRSDGIQVFVNLQTRNGPGESWGSNVRDEEFSRKLEDLILNRAREIRAESLTDIAE